MSDAEEIVDEWDETAVEIRRFAVEQSVLMRSPGDTLTQIFERADKIVDYIASGG